jgi:hypothetical protein
LLEELSNKSILITEHRYSKKYDLAKERGIYCVQFVTFKRDSDGLEALNWWGERCLEWCYARVENGKFGDQKYLDDWLTRFKGVHVLQHLGGGVAPWNVQQYQIQEREGKVYVNARNESIKLIFYHFHYVKLYKNNQVDLGNFKLSPQVLTNVYKIYISDLLNVELMLMEKFQFQRKIQTYFYKSKLLTPLHRIARILLGVYNIYPIKKIKNGTAN